MSEQNTEEFYVIMRQILERHLLIEKVSEELCVCLEEMHKKVYKAVPFNNKQKNPVYAKR